MPEVNQLVDAETRGKVEDELITEKGYFESCSEIKPKGAEHLGSGIGRCVFEKEGYVIKIAHDQGGIAQNQNAGNVFYNVAGTHHEDSFAMPLDMNQSDTIMVQEKVERWREDKDKEQMSKQHDQAEERITEKMNDAWNDTQVMCRDLEQSENWGIKNGEIVLTDLGDCEIQTQDEISDWELSQRLN